MARTSGRNHPNFQPSTTMLPDPSLTGTSCDKPHRTRNDSCSNVHAAEFYLAACGDLETDFGSILVLFAREQKSKKFLMERSARHRTGQKLHRLHDCVRIP